MPTVYNYSFGIQQQVGRGTLADISYVGSLSRHFAWQRNVNPVPCTPDLVVGVINIRGSIYSVIDIRSFFGVEKKDITDLTKVILVSAAGLEVGILADDVKGATSLPLSEVKAALAAQGSAKDEFIQGVTKDMLIILNLEAVLRDERVIVHQEVA